MSSILTSSPTNIVAKSPLQAPVSTTTSLQAPVSTPLTCVQSGNEAEITELIPDAEVMQILMKSCSRMNFAAPLSVRL